MSDLAQFLAQLVPGIGLSLGEVALVPLFLASPLARLSMELLEEGIRDGHTRVTEIGREGNVSEILVEHTGPHPLLLVDGEQVIGAKQNRVVNASFVVPPHRPTKVPVSCVERGRWRYNTDAFGASETTLAPSLRARKLTRVTQSITGTKTYDADQGAVWRDVDEFLEVTRTRSPTSAYDDALRHSRESIERRLATLSPVDGQVGLAMVRAGAVQLVEVFGGPELYARAWRKVARGLLVEAPGEFCAADDEARVRVASALSSLARMHTERTKAPGSGESLHGSVDGRNAYAIVDDGRVVHVIAAAA